MQLTHSQADVLKMTHPFFALRRVTERLKGDFRVTGKLCFMEKAVKCGFVKINFLASSFRVGATFMCGLAFHLLGFPVLRLKLASQMSSL